MTLATHLANNGSLFGHYLWRRGAHTTLLAQAANRSLRTEPTLRPAADRHYPFGTVARAFDYLARMTLAPLSVGTLPAARGAGLLIRAQPGVYPYPLWRDWFGELRATLAQLTPWQAPFAPEIAATLARYAYVLGLLDDVTRAERYLAGPLMIPAPRTTVADLLALAPDVAVQDLTGLLEPFLAIFARQRAAGVIGYPFAPRAGGPVREERSFVVGQRLVAIKTTVDPHLGAADLRYLLGCALLDHQDRLHLRTVGCYLPRQGTWLEWSLAPFVATITGQPELTLSRLRREFQHMEALVVAPQAA